MSALLVKFQRLRFFLGREVTLYFGVAIFLGLLWFVIDASFVFVIQAFLISIGVMQSQQAMLPQWFVVTPVTTGVMLALFGIFRGGIWMLRAYFAAATGQAFIRHQRSMVMEVALRAAGLTTTSEIMLAYNDYTTTASVALQQVSVLVINVVTLTLFTASGLYLAPREFLISIVLLFIALLPTKFLDRKIAGVTDKINFEREVSNRTLTEGLRNNFFLRVYHLVDSEIDRGKKSLTEFQQLWNWYFWYAYIRSSIPQTIGAMVIAGVTYLSLEYFKTPGALLLSFFYIFIRMAQGASDFFSVVADIKVQIVGLKLLHGWAQKLSSRVSPAASEPVESEIGLSEISIQSRDLFFSYSGKNLLKGLNLSVRPGEKLLIKGPSGSGKSTLLSLLLGLLEPTSGAILINGRAPASMRHHLSARIGYVGPEPYLIPGSLRQNLCYGLPSNRLVTVEEIWNALELVQLGDLVRSFTNRLDEEIFENAQMSTGQKQRISIARAILRKPSLLVLDEATANLDPDTESKILSLLPQVIKGVTTVIVSHKDSFDAVSDKTVILC